MNGRKSWSNTIDETLGELIYCAKVASAQKKISLCKDEWDFCGTSNMRRKKKHVESKTMRRRENAIMILNFLRGMY